MYFRGAHPPPVLEFLFLSSLSHHRRQGMILTGISQALHRGIRHPAGLTQPQRGIDPTQLFHSPDAYVVEIPRLLGHGK